MDKIDSRLEILDQARRMLLEEKNSSSTESENILKLLNVLIEAAERSTGTNQTAEQGRMIAADLVRNQALLLTLKQQADELDALKKLSLNLTSSLDLQTVLEAVVAEAMRLVRNAHSAHIFLYTNEKLEFGASLNQDGARNKPISTPRNDGLTYVVAHNGEQVVVENMSSHPLYKHAPKEWRGSIIGIPLKINNTVVGVMNLSRSIVGGFTSSELRLLGLLADQAAVAISNASLHLIVSKQAYSDTVTGLPNRRALDDRLEREMFNARRLGYTFAVVMMDLDGFKVINDTHGHAVGDLVLRAAFNYLATGLRTSDFLARYGGDELTLILSQTDPSAARIVVEKIVEKIGNFSFNAPNSKKVHLGLSAGIALFPLHAATSADLLRAADEALYRAKKHRRGSFIIARGFTGELHQEIS
ncbi:MAG: GGDEF domain-containing protein [Chloroflexi bacterium]|nr:GGDEF domain-containing protein [Chloroflexota bacterium]MBI3340311.1 GGDEF domain-containing protein [Chloroflexota bacterium]